MNKKISVSTSFNYEVPIENQVHMISNAGFSHLTLGSNLNHFNYFDSDNRLKLLRLLNNGNLFIDTIHGKSLHQDKNLELLEKTIIAAKEFGVKYIVVHISPFMFDKKDYVGLFENLKLLKNDLIRLLEKNKIKLALENVFPNHELDLLIEYVKYLNHDLIGICYDSSHDQIDGPRDFTFLERYKAKVMKVHISDRIKEFVDHVIPGEGFINFDKIIELLKQSAFELPLLLEVMMTHSKYNKSPELFLSEAYKMGSEIYKKFVL